MRKLLIILIVTFLYSDIAYAALFYDGESILDIFNFDSQFWSDFGKEGVLRYYFLLLLLIVFFWFVDGLSFLEELFFKKKSLKIHQKRKKEKINSKPSIHLIIINFI